MSRDEERVESEATGGYRIRQMRDGYSAGSSPTWRDERLQNPNVQFVTLAGTAPNRGVSISCGHAVLVRYDPDKQDTGLA